MVNALPAGDGEEPRAETAPAIKLANRLKGPHERVLRHFPGVSAVPARIDNEPIDSPLVAIHQLLKCRQRAVLALPSQLLIRASLVVRTHSAFLELLISHFAPTTDRP
jgi:hypothetical protein